jgi:hypothetical protein
VTRCNSTKRDCSREERRCRSQGKSEDWLSVGLKVDSDALPDLLKQQLKEGKVDLDDPATTLALLKLNPVVGVKGIFDKKGSLQSMGLQCAFCHSTVDDSLAPGIGKRVRSET